MTLTADGRRVQIVYDGTLMCVFVDEYKGSRYAKKIWTFAARCAPEFYQEMEAEIAANDGAVTDAIRRQL